MGLQSALFSPAKYALIPQHLRPAELVGGNAPVETGTSQILQQRISALRGANP
ncbi:MAG: hypothetical protein ACOZDY_13570 [Pseudomonadota bacterium]